jgi:hypothetical protein
LVWGYIAAGRMKRKIKRKNSFFILATLIFDKNNENNQINL